VKLDLLLAADARAEARQIARAYGAALAALSFDVDLRGTSPGEPARPGVDLIHLHPGPATSPELLDALPQGKPLVLFPHDPESLGIAGRGDGGSLRGRAFAARAALVVTPSRRSLVRLLDSVPLAAGQGRILSPGTALELPAGTPRPRAWSGGEALVVLLLGERSEEAGSLDLVRGLAAVSDGEVELLAAGPSRGQFDRRLVREAGALRLDLRPPLASGELAALAQRAHVAAFPSRRAESYALPVDDALALGLPVWASGGEVVLERVDGSAITLLPREEPGAWTAEAEAWIADPALCAAAHAVLPERVPTVADAAAVLGRWSQDLPPNPSERPADPSRPGSPADRRSA